MTRHSEDHSSLDRLHEQLLDSIEQSKEMTLRAQELLDRQRVGDPAAGEGPGGEGASSGVR